MALTLIMSVEIGATHEIATFAADKFAFVIVQFISAPCTIAPIFAIKLSIRGRCFFLIFRG